MPDSPDLSQLNLSETSETGPLTDWLLILNFNPGWTYIRVPGAGTLYVNYEPIQFPQQIYVFHQQAPNSPINPGENKIAVGVGDAILYQLANPGTDSIKLTYQLI